MNRRKTLADASTFEKYKKPAKPYIRRQRGASPVLAWAAGADCRP